MVGGFRCVRVINFSQAQVFRQFVNASCKMTFAYGVHVACCDFSAWGVLVLFTWARYSALIRVIFGASCSLSSLGLFAAMCVYVYVYVCVCIKIFAFYVPMTEKVHPACFPCLTFQEGRGFFAQEDKEISVRRKIKKSEYFWREP